MSTAPTIDREPDATERRSLRWVWWSVLVLVLAGAGVASWLLLAADTEATITYDGTEAVYSGPSQLEAYPNLQAFQLVNDSDNSVNFVYIQVDVDALAEVTEQEAIEWWIAHPGERAPWWYGSFSDIAEMVRSGDTIETETPFIGGRTYELAIWDWAQQQGHWITWIEATE